MGGEIRYIASQRVRLVVLAGMLATSCASIRPLPCTGHSGTAAAHGTWILFRPVLDRCNYLYRRI